MKPSDIKTIICLVCVLVGVLIQFLGPFGIVSFLVGSLLIAVPPFFLSPESIELPKPPASTAVQTRWHTIDDDDIQKTFAHAIELDKRFEAYNDTDKMLAGGCLNYVVLVLAILIGVSCAAADEPHIGAFIIDLALVPWAYIRLKYGKGFRKTFKEDLYLGNSLVNDRIVGYKKDNMIDIHYETRELSPQMQFELMHSGEKTVFNDVRINYPIQKKVPGILCSMVSAAVNNYVYPYSYYVLVFKGNKISKDSAIINELQDCASDGNFGGEISVKDGNTVFVVTKKRGSVEYETDSYDCENLCRIIKKLNACIDSRIDLFKELTA